MGTCRPSIANMKLRQIELSIRARDERSERFNWSANTVANMFEKQLVGYVTDGVFRVNVRAVTPYHSQLRIDSLVDVVEVDAPFDLDYYERLQDFDRRALCAKVIYDALCRVAERRSWQTAPIAQAYASIRSLKYVNVARWGAPKANQSRRVRAQIEYDFGTVSIDGLVRFTNRSGALLGTRELFSLLPSEFYLSEALGRIRWISETRVDLESVDKTRTWSASFET